MPDDPDRVVVKLPGFEAGVEQRWIARPPLPDSVVRPLPIKPQPCVAQRMPPQNDPLWQECKQECKRVLSGLNDPT